jgi:hypothetical protein
MSYVDFSKLGFAAPVNVQPKPWAEGWYRMEINDCDVKTTKKAVKVVDGQEQALTVNEALQAGHGAMFNIWLVAKGEPLDEGESKDGKKLKLSFFFNPANSDNIGWGIVGKVFSAAGVKEIGNTGLLIGKEVAVKIKVKPAEGKYQAGNDLGNAMSMASFSAWKNKEARVDDTAEAASEPYNSTGDFNDDIPF